MKEAKIHTSLESLEEEIDKFVDTIDEHDTELHASTLSRIVLLGITNHLEESDASKMMLDSYIEAAKTNPREAIEKLYFASIVCFGTSLLANLAESLKELDKGKTAEA